MCVNYSFQRKRAFTKRTALGLLFVLPNYAVHKCAVSLISLVAPNDSTQFPRSPIWSLAVFSIIPLQCCMVQHLLCVPPLVRCVVVCFSVM